MKLIRCETRGSARDLRDQAADQGLFGERRGGAGRERQAGDELQNGAAVRLFHGCPTGRHNS